MSCLLNSQSTSYVLKNNFTSEKNQHKIKAYSFIIKKKYRQSTFGIFSMVYKELTVHCFMRKWAYFLFPWKPNIGKKIQAKLLGNITMIFKNDSWFMLHLARENWKHLIHTNYFILHWVQNVRTVHDSYEYSEIYA